MSEKSPWEVLSQIDVSNHIEKKNGLSYLSWAWAWGTLKKHYPYAEFKKHCDNRGLPYFKDESGFAFVQVTVNLTSTGEDKVTEYLPVLDHRNKPIQNPDAFAVNNALQRCLTKAIAYLGLGHYIYAGEDLPESASGGQPVAQAPSPTPKPSSPSAAKPEAPVGIPVVDAPNKTPETVAEVFMQFIPTCKEQKVLLNFYNANKEAIQFLKTSDATMHQRVMDMFSSQKAKLKG